ncbi:MAG: hypothetical protein H6835_08580 [Planctomycetes bacterium]|nr:hypothetical protein [Planctomycetota bacterium]
MKKLLCTLSCSLALLLPACGGHDHDHGGGTGETGKTAGGDAHGARHECGKLTLAGFEFTAVVLGDVAPGKEAVAQAEFAGDALPKTVRAWIGVESGEGSVKERLGKDGAHAMHAHFSAPKDFAADSKLWFEVEHDGKTERGGVAFR